MPNRQFADRLNKELDSIGLSEQHNERIADFAKLLKIRKFTAESFLNGNVMPEAAVLESLADVLEVNGQWLIGKSDERHIKNSVKVGKK
jgi:transcriptional regulator with XRE-family HTH domain